MSKGFAQATQRMIQQTQDKPVSELEKKLEQLQKTPMQSFSVPFVPPMPVHHDPPFLLDQSFCQDCCVSYSSEKALVAHTQGRRHQKTVDLKRFIARVEWKEEKKLDYEELVLEHRQKQQQLNFSVCQGANCVSCVYHALFPIVDNSRQPDK